MYHYSIVFDDSTFFLADQPSISGRYSFLEKKLEFFYIGGRGQGDIWHYCGIREQPGLAIRTFLISTNNRRFFNSRNK